MTQHACSPALHDSEPVFTRSSELCPHDHRLFVTLPPLPIALRDSAPLIIRSSRLSACRHPATSAAMDFGQGSHVIVALPAVLRAGCCQKGRLCRLLLAFRFMPEPFILHPHVVLRARLKPPDASASRYKLKLPNGSASSINLNPQTEVRRATSS
jgi:hypothetical protein